MADELTVKVEPFEPEQRAIDRIERDVRRQPAARELIGGANRRLLSVEPLEPTRRSIRPRPLGPLPGHLVRLRREPSRGGRGAPG